MQSDRHIADLVKRKGPVFTDVCCWGARGHTTLAYTMVSAKDKERLVKTVNDALVLLCVTNGINAKEMRHEIEKLLEMFNKDVAFLATPAEGILQ